MGGLSVSAIGGNVISLVGRPTTGSLKGTEKRVSQIDCATSMRCVFCQGQDGSNPEVSPPMRAMVVRTAAVAAWMAVPTMVRMAILTKVSAVVWTAEAVVLTAEKWTSARVRVPEAAAQTVTAAVRSTEAAAVRTVQAVRAVSYPQHARIHLTRRQLLILGSPQGPSRLQPR